MMWWRPSGLQRQHAFFVLIAWVQRPFVSISRAVWSVLLLAMSLYSAWNNVRHFSDLSSPLAYSARYVEQTWNEGFGWFRSRQSLQDEINLLKAQVQALEKNQQYQHFLVVENQRLREMLNVTASFSWDTQRVEVLAIPFERGAATMWIAASKGMHPQQSVVTHEGLVGRVEAINHHTARVRLITDALSRLPVQVEGTGNEMIIAGQNTDELVMLHQKKSEGNGECIAPQVGMRLITRGYHNLPPNIPVAVISRIENQKIYAQPIASLHQAHYVNVVFDAPTDKESLTRSPELN